MSRKGRELEILIEKLEKCALPEGATIKSPFFINDKITNQPREVDIAIEYKVGTTPILIIIECRDRGSIQDTTWIEQVYSKVNDLNANKVIVVSSSEFTKPAKVKAEFYGIETRTYNEIDKSLIDSWCKIEHMDFTSNRFTVIDVTLQMDDPNFLSQFGSKRNADEKFIDSDSNKEKVSINQIFQAISDQIPDWNNLKVNDPPVRKNVTINYDNPDKRFFLIKGKTKSFIEKIILTVDIQIEMIKVPMSKVSSYKNNKQTFSEVIEFDGVPIKNNEIFQLIRNPDGSISISARKK
jgi:hypothetical protein